MKKLMPEVKVAIFLAVLVVIGLISSVVLSYEMRFRIAEVEVGIQMQKNNLEKAELRIEVLRLKQEIYTLKQEL